PQILGRVPAYLKAYCLAACKVHLELSFLPGLQRVREACHLLPHSVLVNPHGQLLWDVTCVACTTSGHWQLRPRHCRSIWVVSWVDAERDRESQLLLLKSIRLHGDICHIRQDNFSGFVGREVPE